MYGESSGSGDCSSDGSGSDSNETDDKAFVGARDLYLKDETRGPSPFTAKKRGRDNTRRTMYGTCDTRMQTHGYRSCDHVSTGVTTAQPSGKMSIDTSDTEQDGEDEQHPLLAQSAATPTGLHNVFERGSDRPTSRSSLNSQTKMCKERSESSGGEDSSSSSSSGSSSSKTSSDGSTSSFSLKNLSRHQVYILINTCLADLLIYLSISVMAPFFPEEALKKDVSDTVSGWIFGTAPLVQFLFSPVFGGLVQVIGTKFMFSAGLFVSGGCTILMGLLTYIPVTNGNSVFILISFLLQIVKSIGSASVSTASFVLIASAFPDNISTMFGIGEIFVGLGLVAGPAVGGLLYGAGGFMFPFLILGGLSLLLLPVVLLTLPSNSETSSTGTTGDRIPVAVVFRSPTAIITSVAIVISTFSWSLLDPTLEPYLRKYNLSPEMIGVIFLVMAGVYALSSPIWGWLADVVPDQRALLIPGFVIAAFGLLLLGPSQLLGFDEDFGELWLVIVSLMVLGFAASMSSIPTFDLFLTIFEKLGFDDDTRTYGIVAGLWMSMYSFGDFLGPSIGGVLLDYVGFPWMTTIAAGVCALMAICLTINWLVDARCRCSSYKHIDGEPDTPEVAEKNKLTGYMTFDSLENKEKLNTQIETGYRDDSV